ncbi:nuclear pore complex protein Nup133-like isoform X2 [Acanthaster planci]|uniref:Nuclear pore complex protein Nup133-like isoform X2 n=1 Tax=Acanthaster planci TaxID=133434 RepID=A0A8B7XQP3_ACAPL|nr:nuclear pore complex protein Nup133-like isoform X2 [Acanthaster planci]
MYTPRSGSSKGKYTPFSTGRVSRIGGTASSQTRRSGAGIFGGTAAASRRSPFPGTSPAFGNRSFLQTSVIAETAQYTVENYGSSVPVLITEALAMADRSASMSVRINPSGWACVVCGRRLFVWRYKHTFAKATFCKELALPPSELSHKAELVCLIPASPDSQTVSVMAASPEGIIRYWPSIASEGAYAESSADLNGEECFSLTQFEPYGCILATTTNQLLLLSLAESSTQNAVSCHPLKPSQGVLARVSSLFFGSQRPQSSSTLQRVLSAGQEDDQGVLYVLQEDILQKWLVAEPGSEKVVFEVQLGNMIKKGFARQLSCSSLDSLRVWMLDLQIISESILLLVAATDSSRPSPILHYALVLIPLVSASGGGPDQISSFKMMSLTAAYQVSEEESLLDYRLLVASPSGTACHVYSRKIVICCSGVTENSCCFDNVDFSQPGNSILGAGNCEGTTLFFSTNYGLVTVTATQAEPSVLQDVSLAEQSLRLDQSSILGSPAPPPQDISSLGEDKTKGLKAAFLHACRQNLSQAEAIVEELFPSSAPSSLETGSSIDATVAKLSQEVIDDFPASDPRWAESIPQDSASTTTSLILLHQLEDKMKAHDHLLSFLKNVGIWDRLHSVIIRESPLLTHLLLCEHAEKLAAAMALRSHHTMFPNLVDGAISKVLQKRGQTHTPAGLTPQDVFYREVSGIHEIIENLVEQEKDILSTELTPSDIVSMIKNINTILQGMLKEAWHLRQSRALIYQSDSGPASNPTIQYIPWTASAGPKGIRSLLVQQHRITLEQGIPNSEDVQSRGALYQQVMELTDLILEGYVTQLESVGLSSGKDSVEYEELEQKYHQERHALIMPLLEQGQYERAASLAEKYCDFGILVSLCEVTSNEERLQRYMNQFATKGFSDFVFKYYMDKGKRGKLLSQRFTQHAELSEFLQAHDHLSWLHYVQVKDYSKAQETLKRLSAKETLSLAKKKTLLSLSKLTALACEEVPEAELEDINSELDVILNQELLPKELVEKMELYNNEGDLPVIDPEQLIWLYISEKNTEANEFDFKKALDLLQYVPKDDDPKIDLLRLSIWSKAILKDDWSADRGTGVDPLEHYENTVFFRIARLILESGADLEYYLPDVDALLASDELQPLQGNANFQFIVRAGYEQMERIVG